MTKPVHTARLTVYGLDKMSFADRRSIAEWLRKKARELTGKTVNKDYGKSFTARYY